MSATATMTACRYSEGRHLRAEYVYGKNTYPPGTVGHITFWPDKNQA